MRKMLRNVVGYEDCRASLVAQLVKNLPAVQESWVRSLCWEEPLEKEMVTQSGILAWTVPMDRGAWRAAVPGGCKESDTTEQLSTVQHMEIRLWEGSGKVLW